MTSLAKLLEAALFASGRPIATEELAVLDPEASPAELHAALDELRESYDVDGHGIELLEIAEETERDQKQRMAKMRAGRCFPATSVICCESNK